MSCGKILLAFKFKCHMSSYACMHLWLSRTSRSQLFACSKLSFLYLNLFSFKMIFKVISCKSMRNMLYTVSQNASIRGRTLWSYNLCPNSISLYNMSLGRKIFAASFVILAGSFKAITSTKVQSPRFFLAFVFILIQQSNF